MNKKMLTILTTAAMAIATGCATAGTWVNGYYVDGSLCTVCDGTGIEPPETTTIVNTVVVDTWCSPPPPRPAIRHCPPHRPSRPAVRPAPRPVAKRGPRPAARPAPKPPARPASKPAPRGGGRGRRR